MRIDTISKNITVRMTELKRDIAALTVWIETTDQNTKNASDKRDAKQGEWDALRAEKYALDNTI